MAPALASIGDNLPEFTQCVRSCEDLTCLPAPPLPKFAEQTINPLAARLFLWDCPLDCQYKCTQHVTDLRQQSGLRMVQFYGKWPFRRVWGITEIFSAALSGANFYVNYVNFRKVRRHYAASRSADPEKATMLRQYLLLLFVSMAGWTFSTMFHIRDLPVTETLDYLGAGTMVVANFNAVLVRFLGLYRQSRATARHVVQLLILAALLVHFLNLYRAWDYGYNMRFNMLFGWLALFLWIAHSVRVNRRYKANVHVYNNSMHLLPHETRVLTKLQYLGLSRSRYIPLVPAALNLYLLAAICFEIHDFEPWWRLVDCHSLWHLCTIFPPVIWYDWNIWDLEMDSVKTG